MLSPTDRTCSRSTSIIQVVTKKDHLGRRRGCGGMSRCTDQKLEPDGLEMEGRLILAAETMQHGDEEGERASRHGRDKSQGQTRCGPANRVAPGAWSFCPCRQGQTPRPQPLVASLQLRARCLPAANCQLPSTQVSRITFKVGILHCPPCTPYSVLERTQPELTTSKAACDRPQTTHECRRPRFGPYGVVSAPLVWTRQALCVNGPDCLGFPASGTLNMRTARGF